MKSMKNKSSIYVFPKIYYRLLEEGCDSDVVKFIFETYLSDKDDKFVLIIDKINRHTQEKITDKVLDSLMSCESVNGQNVDKIGDNFLVIKVNKHEESKDLINKFTLGKYSEFSAIDKADILDFNFDNCSLQYYIKVGYVLHKSAEYREFLSKEYGMDLKDFPEDAELDDLVNINNELYDDKTREKIEESNSEI